MKRNALVLVCVVLAGLLAIGFAHPAATTAATADTNTNNQDGTASGDVVEVQVVDQDDDDKVLSEEVAEQPELAIGDLVEEELVSSIGVSEGSSSNVNGDGNNNNNLKFHKNTKIGIIGGGPAGLFAARLLSRAGYKKVTVFERSANGPETIASHTVEGKTMDFTTRYIPSIHTEGPGTDPALQAMITEYQAQTTFVSADVSYVDISLGHAATLPLPHIFADFFVPGGAGAAGIIGDLVWGFEVLRAVRATSGVVGCYSAIGVTPGTPVSTWAASVGRPAFTRLAAYTNDAYLGGPSTSQDVCAYLKVRTHFLPGDIVSVLKAFGLTNNSPIPMSDALRSCLATSVNARRKLFSNGYKSFFQALVDAEDFDLIAGRTVVSVKHQDDKNGDGDDKVWVKLDNGAKYGFNKVILATRPVDTLAFLKDEGLAVQPLLQQTTSLPNVHVHAFQTTLAQASAYPGSSPRVFTSLVYPASVFLGTANMPTAVTGLNKEYDDSSVVVAIGYANNDGSSLDEQQRATSTIQSFGYTPTNLVFGKLIPYPVRVAASVAAGGWYAQVDALQGVADYYHIGEAFSGYGVPRVLEETTRVITAAFLL